MLIKSRAIAWRVSDESTELPRCLMKRIAATLLSLVYFAMSLITPLEHTGAQDTSPHTIRYHAINLYQQADHGHLQLIGPMLSPGAPGWKQLSSTQVSGTFREPQRLNGKLVSWLEGRGGTITFPVSESEHLLEELLIWIHPVAPHQVVSIFIDEQLVKNLSLKSKGQFYRLLLPKPLTLGEHSLRLYFRFTRPAAWGGRTPGALGPLSFVPRGQREQMPERWAGEIIYQQRKWGALFAPPPSTWRFYFFPPAYAQLKANLYLPPFAPTTRFQVFASTDSIAEQVIFDQTLEAKHNQDAQSEPIEVDLAPYIGQATRLTLKTQHVKDHPLAKRRQREARIAQNEIGWLTPRIESQYPKPHELPRAKRLIIWAIDGLKLERLIVYPELVESLPSLRLILKQSVRFTRLWSGGARPQDGHKLLLFPPHSKESLISKVNTAGGQSAYIGSTQSPPPKLDVSFSQVDYVDPGELDEHPHQTLLTQVQQVFRMRQILKDSARRAMRTPLKDRASMSHERRQGSQLAREVRPPSTQPKPELIYIHSARELTSRRKYPFKLTSSERDWIERLKLSKPEQRKAEIWLSRLKELDYCLSLLLSELSLASERGETALLLVGSVGSPRKLTLTKPQHLQSHLETSALYYHAKLKWDSPRTLDHAHMSALSDTISRVLISPEVLGQDERGRGTLAPFIMSGTPLPPLVDVAQRGTYHLTRVHDYYLFERPHSAASLWRSTLKDSVSLGYQLENIAPTSPVLLRTLRDRLMISSLFQGLEDVR